MVKPDLKLKTVGSPSDEELSAMGLLRWFFKSEAQRAVRARTAEKEFVLLKSYDTPTEYECCVWQRWIRLVGEQVNPMWAVRIEVEKIMLTNVVTISPWHLLSRQRIAEYQAYGVRTCAECSTEAASGLYSLTDRLAAVRVTFGIQEEEPALEIIESQSSIDPVMRLIFRHSRGLKIPTSLVVAARMRWAYCPVVYAGVPDEVIARYRLKNVFGVVDDHGKIERIGVARLLRSV